MGKLTAKEIAKIVPTPTVQMIAHGDGIALRVSPYNGTMHWRWRFRWEGKQTDISLGEYAPKSHSHVPIRLAEERALKCRELLKQGTKPYQFWNGKTHTPKVVHHTFKQAGDVWFEDYQTKLTKKYSSALKRRLERLLYPRLGNRDITEITAPEILAVIKEIEKAGSIDLARRMKQHASQIFQFGCAHEWCKDDPTQRINAGLAPRPRVRHNPSLKEHELPDFFTRLTSLNSEPITKLAILFTMLTAARTRETRFATKDQIINLDSDNPMWIVPAELMKMRREHMVPLVPQAVSVIRQAYKLFPDSKVLFPSKRSRNGFMSENAMLYALYTMNYSGKSTIHGLRGTFSTILNEQGFNSQWIETSLAHCDDNEVRSSYNSALYLKQRREMLTWFSNFIENKGAKFQIL